MHLIQYLFNMLIFQISEIFIILIKFTLAQVLFQFYFITIDNINIHNFSNIL